MRGGVAPAPREFWPTTYLQTKCAPAKSVKRGAAVVSYFNKDTGKTWSGGKGSVPKWIKDIREAQGDIGKYRSAP